MIHLHNTLIRQWLDYANKIGDDLVGKVESATIFLGFVSKAENIGVTQIAAISASV